MIVQHCKCIDIFGQWTHVGSWKFAKIQCRLLNIIYQNIVGSQNISFLFFFFKKFQGTNKEMHQTQPNFVKLYLMYLCLQLVFLIHA